MASISRDPSGRPRIQFVAPDGKRKTIRLGKVSKSAAKTIKYRVDQLLAAKLTEHAFDADTARWVAGLHENLALKLARADLIPLREYQATTTLQRFLDNYIDGRVDVALSTKLFWSRTKRNLIQFFGEQRDVSTISPGMPTNSNSG